MKILRPRAYELSAGQGERSGAGQNDRTARQLAELFLSNGRMMSKKDKDVKTKVSYGIGRARGGTDVEKASIAVGLSEDIAREAVAEEEARAGILGGERGEAFARGVQVASAFEAEIPAVGVFHQNVKAKITRGGIRAHHKQLLS
jgi:hypothetical protein